MICAPQPKRYPVNSTRLLCIAPSPTQVHDQAIAIRRSAQSFSTSASAVNGFARAQVRPCRFSAARLSGSTNRSKQALPRDGAAAMTKGIRRLQWLARPPSAGPTTNPAPNVALTRPYSLGRSSRVETSAMEAVAAATLAEVAPATRRPTNSHHRLGASASRM